jgi:hypothetical protein
MARRAGEAAADIARGGFSCSPQARARGAPGGDRAWPPSVPRGEAPGRDCPPNKFWSRGSCRGCRALPQEWTRTHGSLQRGAPPDSAPPCDRGTATPPGVPTGDGTPPRYTGLPPYPVLLTPARPRRVTPISLAAGGQVSLPGRGPPRALQQVVRRRHHSAPPGAEEQRPLRRSQELHGRGSQGAAAGPGEPPRYQGPPGGAPPDKFELAPTTTRGARSCPHPTGGPTRSTSPAAPHPGPPWPRSS